MRSMRKLGVLVAVFALCAIGAANASAAPTFTASETGSITGSALKTQVFTTSAGTVNCNTLEASGTIEEIASPDQHAHVTYKNCTGPFGVPVHNITATYTFTADGTVHIIGSITITVTAPFGATCHITVPEQTIGTVSYINSGSSVELTPHVTGIEYKGSGGFCGSETLSNGTYTGNSLVSRVGGGSISWDE